MSQFAQAILESNYNITYKNSIEFVQTELGGEFYPESMNICGDGNGFTMIVQNPFTYFGKNYYVNQSVTFDSNACLIG